MSDGSSLHFIISLLMVFCIPFLFKNKMLGVGIALILTLFCGIGKEIYDNIVNPWNLGPNALYDDTYHDLWMNCLGTISGFVLFIAGTK